MGARVIRLLFVFGTRPEAVKLAPLIHAARSQSDRFEVKVCVTAQHREMLDQVMDLFRLEADYDLDLMQREQSLASLAAVALPAVCDVVRSAKPDWVIVQGDTTTTWVAALAASYSGVRVAHVEAGLRTYNRGQPFPEELNRRLCTQLTDLHLAPTLGARDNLIAERIPAHSVFVTGNTAIDALMSMLGRIEGEKVEGVNELREWVDDRIGDDKLVLITCHRRESFGVGFRHICLAIRELANIYSSMHWVYPVHLNPNVQRPVRRYLSGIRNVHLLPPLTYAPFVWMMSRSTFVLTDSGGVQEEAPSLKKPVLVMRNATERPEGIEQGLAKLVGNSIESIVAGCVDLLESRWEPADVPSPYGDGRASERILAAIAGFR